MSRPARILGHIEILKQTADIVVQLLDHRTIKWVGLPLTCPLSRIFRQFDAEFLNILLQQRFASRMDRRMHQPSRIIEEERLIRVLRDELHGVFTVLMIRETILIQPVRIALLGRSKACHAMWAHPCRGAEVVPCPIKALIFGLRIRIMINRHMPLSAMPGRIAILLQHTRQRQFALWHASAIPRWHHTVQLLVIRSRWPTAHNVRLLRTRRMVATHNRTSRRGTCRRRRIRLPKQHALFGQRIDIRRLHRRGLVDVVAFHILPAKVIGQQQNYIWLRRPRRLSRSTQRCRQSSRSQHNTDYSKFRAIHRYY